MFKKFENVLKTKSFFKESLFLSINMTLKVFTTIVGLIFIIWLFLFMSPKVTEHQIYEPKEKVKNINLVLDYIRIEGNWEDLNSTSENFHKINSCLESKTSETDWHSLINNGVSFNESLKNLYQEGFLKYQYSLDIDSIMYDVCQKRTDVKSLKNALSYIRGNSYFDLHYFDWKEKKVNFDPKYPPYISMPDGFFKKKNPWLGLPGCIYVSGKFDDNKSNKLFYYDKSDNDKLYDLCSKEEMKPTHWKDIDVKDINSTKKKDIFMPPDLSLIISDLDDILTMKPKKTTIDIFQDHVDYQQEELGFFDNSYEQKVNFHGTDVKVAFSSSLTLDPIIQNITQKTAICATGSKDKMCENYFTPTIQNRMSNLYEDALVRSVGIAIMDIKTQKIDALGSSHTSCFTYDHGIGGTKEKECPSLWKRDFETDKLFNHAVYGEYEAGSIVKIPQSLGLIRAFPDTYGDMENQHHNILKQQVAESTTNHIVNALFCQDKATHFDEKGICRGMEYFSKSATDLGFNNQCIGEIGVCGKKDILFGADNIVKNGNQFQQTYLNGRVMTNGTQIYSDFSFTDKQVKECMKNSGNNWDVATKCGQYNPIIGYTRNESYGQGNALVSPLGVANMMTRLLVAANGNKFVQDAHIIEDIWDIKHNQKKPIAWKNSTDEHNMGKKPLNISQLEAEKTTNLLSGVLNKALNGTAQTACSDVGIIDCDKMDIAGKTGTPGSTDNFPISKIKKCEKDNHSDICQKRPIKSFVFAFKGNDGKWSKAIAVTVERNWTKKNELDHSGNSNPAAIIALQVYKELMKGKQSE